MPSIRTHFPSQGMQEVEEYVRKRARLEMPPLGQKKPFQTRQGGRKDADIPPVT